MRATASEARSHKPKISINYRTITRFEQLEIDIKNYRGTCLRTDLLNDYLDTGIELALEAGENGLTRLQESWLRRVYNTLRNTALNLSCPEAWRLLCRDSMYQPFFALKHIYKDRQDGRQSMRYLTREMQFISRYLI